MCSGCQTRHPAFLFSHPERQKKDDERVCIGRQGHIRLCAHRTISYEDATKIFGKRFPACFEGHYGWSAHDSEYLREIVCSDCSRSGWTHAATFRWEGADTAYKQIDISHTLEDMSRRKSKDLPKCAEEMLSAKPSLGACIHFGDLKSEVLPALLQEEQKQQRKSGKKDCTRHRHQLEVACHMPSCKYCVQVENIDETVSIRAFNEFLAESPTDPGWLAALDPESYLGDADELTRGLMWCRDPACGVTKRGRGLYKVFHQWDLPHKFVRFNPRPRVKPRRCIGSLLLMVRMWYDMLSLAIREQ